MNRYEENVDTLLGIIKMLYRKAERVDELEELLEDYKQSLDIEVSKNDVMLKKEEEYEEILHFYVNEDNWDTDTVTNEEGFRARRVLEEVETKCP